MTFGKRLNGWMFLVVSILFLFPAIASAEGLAALLVEKVGDMDRIQLVTGAAAQAEVDKLHGKSLSAEASALARYAVPGSDNRPAEVWVSRVASEAEARRQVGQMVHLMFENPRSPFGNPRRIEHKGRAVYRFEGMGQSHLIWYAGDLVYWISTPPMWEEAMMGTFCK